MWRDCASLMDARETPLVETCACTNGRKTFPEKKTHSAAITSRAWALKEMTQGAHSRKNTRSRVDSRTKKRNWKERKSRYECSRSKLTRSHSPFFRSTASAQFETSPNRDASLASQGQQLGWHKSKVKVHLLFIKKRTKLSDKELITRAERVMVATKCLLVSK